MTSLLGNQLMKSIRETWRSVLALAAGMAIGAPASTCMSAGALVASMTAVYAAPCSQEIERVQAHIDAKLEAAARIGALAPESAAALLHRQPTPGSIAAAENRLGEVSSAIVATVAAAMARAREAEGAGDATACEQALADVQRAIGP
jgi:hypothetical protein